MSITSYALTTEGLESRRKEYEELTKVRLPEILTQIQEAREEKDALESGAFEALREDLHITYQRIAELKAILSKAKIIPFKPNASKVDLGSQVTLHLNNEKSRREKLRTKNERYYIVGEWETDPASKKISSTSPLGKALIGKKVGDKVKVKAPIGNLFYQILSIA